MGDGRRRKGAATGDGSMNSQSLKWLHELFRASRMGELLYPTCQSVEVSRERYGVIISRAQFIAQLFAVLTIVWILVDTLTLGWPYSALFAAGRVVTAGGFLMLARHRFVTCSARAGYAAVAALFGLCVGFTVFSAVAFWWLGAGQETLFTTATYLNAPFLIAAGLGVFPLTGIESAALMVVVILAMTLSIQLQSEALASFSASAALWRLFLIAVISAAAGMSQLRFLINLTEQSTRDALTEALTRRCGEEMLEIQFAIAERANAPLSVVFFDLDKFKSVNDQFGHEAGDQVLRCAGQSLRKSLRRQDSLIRWGGEEFVAILPQTDSTGADTFIARIAQVGIGLAPDRRRQTASIGIAERRRDNPQDWQSLVRLADERMYCAKRAGRNRCVAPGGRAVQFVRNEITDSAVPSEQQVAADNGAIVGDSRSWTPGYSI